MAEVDNINYKKVLFTRSDGVLVFFKVAMVDSTDLDENFHVLTIENINTPEEIRLFYWIDQKRWTLNEFKFFALNNNLCMQILSKDDTILASYGNCGSANRLHGLPYNELYN